MENNAIQIIEKEPYYHDSPFTGNCWMYPTYMVKDGKEYFMFNRRDPDDSWKLEENERRKQQLLSTGGAFMRFHGFYAHPIEMLAEVAKRKHHFTDPEKMYYCDIEDHGFLDFHGNRREVSAAFHYRIYDVELATKVKKAVEAINREDWANVEL